MDLHKNDVPPLNAQTQRDAVVEAIQRIVLLGLIPVGERLPPERELAPILGVSRRTLRSAVHQLAEDGLVEITVGRKGGAWVRQPPLDGEKVTAYLDDTRRVLVATYEARLVVEPALARFAAERSDSDLAEELVSVASDEPETVVEVRTVDSRFHALVGVMANNDMLRLAADSARAEFFRWADMLWMPFEEVSKDDWTSREQHLKIATAISRGEGAKAAAAMRNHLRWSLTSFERRMPPAKPDPS